MSIKQKNEKRTNETFQLPGYWYPKECDPSDETLLELSKGMFYTKKKLDSGRTHVSMRLWEEGSWWFFGKEGWVPNNSFDEWLFIDPLTFPSLAALSDSLGADFEHGV